MQIIPQNQIILIDSRYSIYQHRLKDQVTYSPGLIQFILELKEMNRNFYFVFSHERNQLNLKLSTMFIDKCQTSQIDITPNTIMFDDLPEFPSNEIIVITHKLQYFEDLKLKHKERVSLFLFSSYIKSPSKKLIEEEIFYKQYFGDEQSQHISSLQQIRPYISNQNYPQGRCVVGYFFYPKKLNDFVQNSILFDSDKVRMVPIDFRFQNRTQYDKLDVLFHKIQGSSKDIKTEGSELLLKNYQSLILDYPKIQNIDPIVKEIGDRVGFSQLFDEICLQIVGVMDECGRRVKTPNFKEISNGSKQLISADKYPCIVKTKEATFTSNSHTMAIVVNQAGLNKVMNIKEFSGDLIIQDIINHDGRIFKVYSVGVNSVVQIRKSIPNIEEQNFKFQEGYNVFNSQKDIFTQVSQCLNEIKIPDLTLTDQMEYSRLMILINVLTKQIIQKFRIQIFGYDLIQCSTSKDYYIIDINHFPGFKNVISNQYYWVGNQCKKFV